LIVRIIQGIASEQELKKVQSEIKDDPSANHSWGCLEAFLRAIGCGDKAEKVAKLQKDAHASPKACEHSASSNLREAGRVKASTSSQHSDEVVRSQQTARLASGKGASSSGRGSSTGAQAVRRSVAHAQVSPKAREQSASSNLREAGRVKASTSSQHSDEVVRSQQTARLASGKGASSSGRGSSTGAQAARRSATPPGGKSGQSTAKSK
jgi:hypothetical protein